VSAGTLRPADFEQHARFGIPPELLTTVARRVTDKEAREHLGVRHTGDLAGVLYARLDPETGVTRGYRLRRDHPEIEDGKPRDKYLSSIDRPALFFAPGVGPLLTDTTVTVATVEAEKSSLALTAAATRAGRRLLTIGTGGVWSWRGRIGKTVDANGARVDVKGPLPDLDRVTWQNRDVVILFDSNTATNENAQAGRRALAAELARRGAKVRIVELPVETDVNGPDDYVGKHGDAALFALIDAAKPGTTSKSAKAAKPKQGRDVQLDDPEPWPVPVNGAALLETIAGTFTRYLALPAHASTAIALWVLHAYAFKAWFTSPFLAITSPVKRCGKTLLLIVLGAIVPRRLFASNVTPAVLFRTIEKYRPTLLIDEADTFIRENDELRGVLNSGHTRTTAVVIRAVGDDHDPRAFSTWCAKAVALIGRLPDTLADRAIEITMRRRTVGEHVERLRQDRIESECASLRRLAARWAVDHLATLQDADPDVPTVLHDRAADCWRPLFAIADRVGGHWPAAAREAAKAISGVDDEGEQPAAILLLDDVRTIFGPVTQDVSSADLVKALRALDSRPWATWGKDDKGLTTHGLARLLKAFTIHPVKIRFGDDTANGYTRRMFEDAWSRYTPLRPEQRNNSNNDGPEPAFLKPEHPKTCSTSENAGSTNNDGLCSSVPLQYGENREVLDL
jgi:putative DNA primase/helicase